MKHSGGEYKAGPSYSKYDAIDALCHQSKSDFQALIKRLERLESNDRKQFEFVRQVDKKCQELFVTCSDNAEDNHACQDQLQQLEAKCIGTGTAVRKKKPLAGAPVVGSSFILDVEDFKQTKRNDADAKAVAASQTTDLKLARLSAREVEDESSDSEEEDNDGQLHQIKRHINVLYALVQRLSVNTGCRLSIVEEIMALRSDENFHGDYADLLDVAGCYFPDELHKRSMRNQPWPATWSTQPQFNTRGPSLPPPPPVGGGGGNNNNWDHAGLLGPQATVRAVATPSVVPVTAVAPLFLGDDAIKRAKAEADITWHYPTSAPEKPPQEHFIRVYVDTSLLKAKSLYGLFVKLRRMPQAGGKAEPGPVQGLGGLESHAADMVTGNKVILLEYQTNRSVFFVVDSLNRAKKLNGVQRFKFSGVPIIQENNMPPSSDGVFFLEEKEPLRVVQNKPHIPLLQYDTTFGPSKKRLLKVAHVTIDNRRKYRIVCGVEYWPVYEIWEMSGARPMKDRVALIFRGSEVPVDTEPPVVTNHLAPAVNASPDDCGETEGDNEEDEKTSGCWRTPSSSSLRPPWNTMMMGVSSKSTTMMSSMNTGPTRYPAPYSHSGMGTTKENRSGIMIMQTTPSTAPNTTRSTTSGGNASSATTMTGTGAGNTASGSGGGPSSTTGVACAPAQAGLNLTTDQAINQDSQWLVDFAEYWQGDVRQMMTKENDQYVCTIQVTLWLPSLAPSPIDSKEPSITVHTLPVSHNHRDDQLAFLGAQHAALMRIRRDYHPHWTMFVLQLVPFSEAYCQFLQTYSSHKTPDNQVHKWFETSFNQTTRITTCAVKYGGDAFRDSEVAQHTDPNIAREDASFLAMTQMQAMYQHCYLLVRPADTAEAMASFLRIHSGFGEELLRENKNGSLHQWWFRGTVLAEGHCREVSTGRILQSMDTICRSHIQRHVVMSKRFDKLLRDYAVSPPNSPHSPSSVSDDGGGGVPPTRGAMRNLDAANRQKPNLPPVSYASAAKTATTVLPMSIAHSTKNNLPSYSGQSQQQTNPPREQSINPGTATPQRTVSVATASTAAMPTAQKSAQPSAAVAAAVSSVPSSSSTPPQSTGLPPSREQFTNQIAYQLFEKLGISVMLRENAKDSAIARLNHMMWVLFQSAPNDTENMYQFSMDSKQQHFCTFVLNGTPMGSATSGDKSLAQQRVAEKVLTDMKAQQKYLRKFLIEPPPENDGNPTSTLLQFLQVNSIYKEGDELQGIYRSFMHTTPHGTPLPLFECRLEFKKFQVGVGRGDTKRRSREEASRDVIRNLHKAISLVDVAAVQELHKNFNSETGVVTLLARVAAETARAAKAAAEAAEAAKAKGRVAASASGPAATTTTTRAGPAQHTSSLSFC